MSSKSYSTDAYEAALNQKVGGMQIEEIFDDDEEEQQKKNSKPAASNPSSSSSPAADSPTSDSDAAPTHPASDAPVAEPSSSSAEPGAADPSAPLTIEEVVEKDAAKALQAKVRGNEFFARQQYDAAISEYSLAIQLCPEGEEASAENKEQLSVYYSNRAACFLMQSNYEQTISDCSSSLLLHPNNPKPLSRRAKAHEKLDQLQEAVEDLKALVAIDPRDRDAVQALARVEKALNEKNEKMKAEMMGKLKDFGNTILGKFGMSLDNFKATQDPSTGSYNISFNK